MIITDYQGNHYLVEQTPDKVANMEARTKEVIEMIKTDSSLSQRLINARSGVKNLSSFLRLFFFGRIDFVVSDVNWTLVASYVAQLENTNA